MAPAGFSYGKTDASLDSVCAACGRVYDGTSDRLCVCCYVPPFRPKPKRKPQGPKPTRGPIPNPHAETRRRNLRRGKP